MRTLQVQFELPTQLVTQAGLSSENVNQEVRRILALFLYEHGRVSLGKACEIGGMSLWEFAEMNQQLDIPMPYTNEQLQEDLARLAHV